MVVSCGCGGVLCHDADEGVGHIGCFEIGTFLGGEGEVRRFGSAVDVVHFVAPTIGAVTFVSSQARETSVIETPCFSASSATRSMMT